ncbi:hypothetical protein BJ742DRAFT_277323 [Cladochytrium replicatum]|nr:hypothetical protein BJ742DRAFT_277323 [Cladochytrium replicatum]
MDTHSECSVLDLLCKSECIKDVWKAQSFGNYSTDSHRMLQGSVAFDPSLLPSSVLQALPPSFLSNELSMLDKPPATMKYRSNDAIEVAPPFYPDKSARNSGHRRRARANSAEPLSTPEKHVDYSGLPRSGVASTREAPSGHSIGQMQHQIEQESQKAYHFHNCHFHLASNDLPPADDAYVYNGETLDSKVPDDGVPRPESAIGNVHSGDPIEGSRVQDTELEEILHSVNAILCPDTGSSHSAIGDCLPSPKQVRYCRSPSNLSTVRITC